MNVLWIFGELPIPADSGVKLRMFGLFKELAGRHQITGVVLQPGPDTEPQLAQLRELCHKVEVLPWRGRTNRLQTLWGAATSALAKLPYGVIKYCGPETEAALAQLAAGPFDTIVCENTGFYRYLASRITARTILMAHNVEAQIFARWAQLCKNPLLRAYLKRQSHKMAHYERWLMAQYDMTVAVSEEDAAAIKCGYGISQVAIAPNAVDIRHFVPSATPPEPGVVVFSGAMDYAPNDDAMRYFLKDIWPKVVEQAPDTQLIIAGKAPGQSLRKLAGDARQVSLTGWVEDIAPYLARAGIVIVPLRMGGGSRLKILEAMAMAKPIVSTSLGAEGLRVVPDQHLVIADSAQGFADQVLALLNDPARRAELGRAARQLVEAQYSWAISARRLEEAWEQAVAGEQRQLPFDSHFGASK